MRPTQKRSGKSSPGRTCASRHGRAFGTTPIKTEEQQSVLMMHRARDLLVRQLTQVRNASS